MIPKCVDSVLELICNTPMVCLHKMPTLGGAKIYVKLESFNPGGSVKDRICLSMIEAAEKEGLLKAGATIIEPTSGNTGIGLALVAAYKGYKLILTMPESMSVERRNLLKAYGAELILTPASDGMGGAIRKAEELARENSDYFLPQQFKNLANPEIHRRTTAREIIAQTEGRVSAFVAGVGTGGTITGVGEVLKQELENVKCYAVEPIRSAVLSGRAAGPHRIQGIGAGFIPDILDLEVVDEVLTVTEEDAIDAAQKLARTEGILVGISAGAALWSAIQVASKMNPEQIVVVVLPDTGERYLSTDLFG